jgi:hypothetical protein
LASCITGAPGVKRAIERDNASVEGYASHGLRVSAWLRQVFRRVKDRERITEQEGDGVHHKGDELSYRRERELGRERQQSCEKATATGPTVGRAEVWALLFTGGCFLV